MRRHAAITQVLLFGFGLSGWFLIAEAGKHEALVPGTPLSDAEYEDFFRIINHPRKIGPLCLFRASFGCQHSMIRQLDLYENHGFVPKGQVCSSLEEHQTFLDFCSFALYRCAMKKYFVKRVLCPSEIRKTSTVIQIIDQHVEPDENTASPKIVDNTLSAATAATAATSTTTKSFLEQPPAVSTTAPEVLPPLPTFPAASTTTAESGPEPPVGKVAAKGSFFKILVESTAQIFTPAVIITTPKPPPKVHPVAFTSGTVSAEVHTRGEPPAELHPAMPPPPPQMASPKLRTTPTPVASTSGSVSKAPATNSAPPATLKLLAAIAARTEIQSSPEHFAASEGLSAEETSPGRSITTTASAIEDIVSESSILMGASVAESLHWQVISSIGPTTKKSSSEHTTATTAPTTASSTTTKALSGGRLTTETRKHPLVAGTPLSGAEYEDFFRVINHPRKIGPLCLFRVLFGCQQSVVRKFDLYENHGMIPKGRVCANLEEHPAFPDFCSFALYRCAMKKHFVKRVLCPSETGKEASAETQIADQKVEADGSILSPEIVDKALSAATTAGSTTAKSFLEQLLAFFSTTATEPIPKPPVKKVPAKGPFFKLRLEPVAQPFTPTVITTASKPCPVAQTSTGASSGAEATEEPPPELLPATLPSPVASLELSTTSTSGTSTKVSISVVPNSVPAVASQSSLVLLLGLLLSFLLLLPLQLL